MKELEKDQLIFSIRKNGEVLGYIESQNGKFVTSGMIGENEYETLTELIRGLYGFGIEIDNFFT
jgi:hypothetical protein